MITCLNWLCTFRLTWGACKHRSAAGLQGAEGRIWIWPWIISWEGGLAYYSAGRRSTSWIEKYGIRTRSKDKFESTLDSSAAARVNRPHNTSLTSVLTGQSKTAGVMCRENVFTGHKTYGWHRKLMWSVGYTILYKSRPWGGSLFCKGDFFNSFRPGHHCCNVTAVNRLQRTLLTWAWAFQSNL